MRSRLQLHLLLTAMICHLLHHRALGQQDEEATAAISCLVKRPGHGLVSELCPVDSRACRIKVRDDQSIEYYPFGRHYDRARLACVRASEMTVKRHSTDCHRLPSGAVRCWCGHRRDCNDEASALLLFRTFRDYGSKGVERLRQKWEQEAHNQRFGPIDLDVYSGDDESAPTSSTSTTTPTTTTTTTTTSTPSTTTTLSTTTTTATTTVTTTSKLPRVIYFGPNEEDDVGEDDDDDEGLDIANLEEDEETDARLADTLWTKMTDEARAAVKYVQEHDADKGANEEEEDDDGDDDDRGADKEGGRPVKVHIRPLVNKSLEKGGGNYVVEKTTTTGAPPPSATTAKKRKKTTTTTTESAQKQWEDEEDDYEEEEMSDDDRRRDNDLSMFRPFAKRNHSPAVSCSIGVASMAFILAALERL